MRNQRVPTGGLVGSMVGITRVRLGREGDALFFHYSGHGGREENPNAASGYVETLCPEVRFDFDLDLLRD